MFRSRLLGRASRGAQYWTNNMFVFADEAGSTFQVDSWLKPMDQLIRMYWHVPIEGSFAFPDGVDLRQLDFPLDHPAASRVCGVTVDKIRFFSKAYTVAAPSDLVPLMTDPSYGGNILLVDAASALAGAPRWSGQQPVSSDDSVALQYRVISFDANNLILTVSNPGAASWMLYSDVWHPFWHATVNHRSVPVHRANMAYKAIQIDPGENEIHFHFSSPLFSFLSTMLAANAGLWLVLLPSLTTKENTTTKTR
jgi:hypothetical protein